MSTSAWTLYDNFRSRQMTGNAGNLAASGNSVKVALITSALAPTTATDVDWNTPGYTEVSGTNYTAGGLAIDSGQSVALSAGVVTYTTSVAIKWLQNAGGFSNARYAIIYDNTASGDGKKTLIAWFDLASNVGNVAGDLTITLPSSAIFTSP